MNIAIIVAAVVAMLSPTVVSSQEPACFQVARGATYGYYQPDTHAQIVGRFVADEELELRKDQGDWMLVMGHGVDSAWRKARMTSWVETKNLRACQ